MGPILEETVPTIERWPATAKLDDFFVALFMLFVTLSGAFTMVSGIVMQWRDESRMAECEAKAAGRRAEEKRRAVAEVSDAR